LLKRGEGSRLRSKLESKRRQRKRERGRKPRSPRSQRPNLLCTTSVDRHRRVQFSKEAETKKSEMMKSTKEEKAARPLNQLWLQRLPTLPICP
jgi:hypothetical protein